MLIGSRLRELREARKMSQGDVERRTGLLRCYTSRVENGHTVPSLETMEKYARALDIPLYQLFYTGAEPPKLSPVPPAPAKPIWGSKPREAAQLARFCRALSKMDASRQRFLLALANAMIRRKGRPRVIGHRKAVPGPAAPAPPAQPPPTAPPTPAPET